MTRDELIYMSKVCEQTERFEDMLDYIKKAVVLGADLTPDERNLLSIAFKNFVG